MVPNIIDPFESLVSQNHCPLLTLYIIGPLHHWSPTSLTPLYHWSPFIIPPKSLTHTHMVSLSLGVAKHQMIRFFAQQQPLIAERDLEMKTKQSQQLETNRDGKRRRRR